MNQRLPFCERALLQFGGPVNAIENFYSTMVRVCVFVSFAS